MITTFNGIKTNIGMFLLVLVGTYESRSGLVYLEGTCIHNCYP